MRHQTSIFGRNSPLNASSPPWSFPPIMQSCVTSRLTPPPTEIRSLSSFHHHSRQYQAHSRCLLTQQIAVLTPPNCCRVTHVPTAFLSAVAGTKLTNDVNRSIGQTGCVRTAGDAPNVAADIAVCNCVVVVDERTIISPINNYSDNLF